MKKLWLVGSIITIGAICLAATVVLIGISWRNARLGYIQNVTGITLPFWISQVDTFDNLETFFVAHVKLREQDIAPFTKEYAFNTTPVLLTPWIDTLGPKNRTLPVDADLWYLEGRSEHNRWLCTLDQKSGRLWIVVFYPDPGGTPP